MYLVGLTGGIASGKSTVAQRWIELGAAHIDADQLAREVVEPGTLGLAKVVSEFGSDILLEDGSLDRAKLGQIIFSDPATRSTLEAIIHPLVRERAQQLLSTQQPDAIVVYNVPLLVEAKVDLPFDKVVTVEAPADKQLERLLKYRGMTKAEAQLRIDSQATPAARANIADAILNSNQDLPGLLKDATALWQQIEREALAKQNA